MPKSGLSIRKLRADDLQTFFEPAQHALGQKWLTRQRRGWMYVAVARFDGRPVGRTCLHYDRMGDPPNAYIFASSVYPAWHSRGIGSALVAHVEGIACSRGMYHISAHTATHNTRAAAWFEKMGYRRVREETIHWDEPDGRRVESHCWRFERTLIPSVSERLVNSVTIGVLKSLRRLLRKPK